MAFFSAYAPTCLTDNWHTECNGVLFTLIADLPVDSVKAIHGFKIQDSRPGSTKADISLFNLINNWLTNLIATCSLVYRFFPMDNKNYKSIW